MTHNLKKFFKGFVYAFSGFIGCIRTERNMRFHIGAAIYVICFMYGFYDLRASQKAAVFICIALVISAELFNTAIENACDMACGGKKDSRAKTAKDCAAAAVLIVSVAAFITGILIFWDTSAFSRIYDYYSSHVISLIFLIMSLVAWVIWILSTKGKKKNE